MDKNSVNTLRLLSVNMVENAKSGHPGMPLGCSPMIYVLFKNFLNFNSKDSVWINRDRFILSNGHGCSLLYSILHLLGYKISIDDLKNFRKLGSITPGHPEKNITDGIEVTTGPLGQGFANGVGMALALKHLKSRFNTNDIELFDNKVYVMCGDGCLMEGIVNEASSFAGHQKLDNLIVLYDDNMITIDGSTNLGFTENTKLKFEALGWKVYEVKDGNNDLDLINKSLQEAQNSDKPVLIKIRTSIGYGSDKEGSEKSHGAPLGQDNLNKLRFKFDFPIDKDFYIPEDVKEHFDFIRKSKLEKYNGWIDKFNNYKISYPEKFNELKILINNTIPDLNDLLPKFNNSDKSLATRQISGMCLKNIYKSLPQLIGGSADLSPSNNTVIDDGIQSNDYSKRYIHYGVREHAMCGIANGISTCYLVPYVATFLVFINYCLGAIRLSAQSKHQVIYILTHDSIGLGEDGPTHQPVESLTILRSLPNCFVFRPADGNEVSGCYKIALERKTGPSCLCLSRQSLPQLEGSSINSIKKGGYILYESKTDKDLELILIATGSEVSLSLEAIKKLENENMKIRLVSMPCVELFDLNNKIYKDEILPKNVLKISIEAGATLMWHKYADKCIGIDTFGESGRGSEVMDYFGFSVDKIVYYIKKIISNNI